MADIKNGWLCQSCLTFCEHDLFMEERSNTQWGQAHKKIWFVCSHCGLLTEPPHSTAMRIHTRSPANYVKAKNIARIRKELEESAMRQIARYEEELDSRIE